MPAPPPAPLWDVFCRVVDHRGDAGVAWRLSRNLAQRGQRVRLWIDLVQALDGMADDDDRHLVAGGAVQVRGWDEADAHAFDAPPDTALPLGGEAGPGLGDRLVELFGCEPPGAAVRARARRATPPPWINLEYLSAEPYVERSHRLRSPLLAGPASGQARWFFYPGFTPRTGGLLREPGLLGARDAHDPAAWWPEAAGPRPPRLGSLFHYPLPPELSGWPRDLATRLGPAWRWARPGAGHHGWGTVQDGEQAWPWLTQSAYDRLLWSCELNVVRGEDSFVRAQWAARPFVWHAYVQHDGAHGPKVEAFLDRYLADADAALAIEVRTAFRALNGLAPAAALVPALERALRPGAGWSAHAQHWAAALGRQADLATQLMAFAAERQADPGAN